MRGGGASNYTLAEAHSSTTALNYFALRRRDAHAKHREKVWFNFLYSNFIVNMCVEQLLAARRCASASAYTELDRERASEREPRTHTISMYVLTVYMNLLTPSISTHKQHFVIDLYVSYIRVLNMRFAVKSRRAYSFSAK